MRIAQLLVDGHQGAQFVVAVDDEGVVGPHQTQALVPGQIAEPGCIQGIDDQLGPVPADGKRVEGNQIDLFGGQGFEESAALTRGSSTVV